MKSHRAALLLIINLSNQPGLLQGRGESDFQVQRQRQEGWCGDAGTFLAYVPWITFAPSQRVIDTSSQVLRMAQFELQGGLLLENGQEQGTAFDGNN